MWIRQLDDTMLAALPELWSGLEGLHIAGEQRQHLQPIDIRNKRGMMDTGPWYIVPTHPQDTCDCYAVIAVLDQPNTLFRLSIGCVFMIKCAIPI